MAEPWKYEIQVQGRIGERWAHWFDDVTVSALDEAQSVTTTLTATVADQSALLGLLQTLHMLWLPLLLVRRIVPMEGEDGRDSQ